MNDERRKKLRGLMEQVEAAKGELETIREEEALYFDNIPENMQGSDKYQKAEQAIENLDEAISALESFADNIEAAVE